MEAGDLRRKPRGVVFFFFSDFWYFGIGGHGAGCIVGFVPLGTEVVSEGEVAECLCLGCASFLRGRVGPVGELDADTRRLLMWVWGEVDRWQVEPLLLWFSRENRRFEKRRCDG